MGRTKVSTAKVSTANGTAGEIVPAAEGRTEVTAAVVIGCGLTGLAVVSELNRQGVDSIVLNGLQHDSDPVPGPAPVAMGLPERGELLRLLHGYAAGHSLDIRRGTAVQGLGLLRGSGVPAPVTGTVKWAVRTPTGLLLADTVVLAGCGQPAVLKLLRSLGFATGTELRNAVRSVGLYVVGAGEAITSPTRELVRQAKRAGQEVAVRTASLDRHSGSHGLRAGTA